MIVREYPFVYFFQILGIFRTVTIGGLVVPAYKTRMLIWAHIRSRYALVVGALHMKVVDRVFSACQRTVVNKAKDTFVRLSLLQVWVRDFLTR